MKLPVLETVKRFSWKQWLVLAAFLLILGFTGLQAVRTVRHAIYWHYHQDEPIRGWMTIGYVAHSYHVPPHVLHQALGLRAEPDRRPLREIAKAQNRSLDEVTAILQDAIVRSRPPYPPPPGPGDRGNR